MKSLILILFFFTASASYSQKKEIKSFNFQEIEIEYTRVEYSKYGITQFFIIMYDDIPENNKIEKKSIKCLEQTDRLYHTLYFFLKIPKTIKTQTDKTKLFSEFIAHLNTEEKLRNINLYLNFDKDYSMPYELSNDNVKRVVTDINNKNICKALFINL